MKSKERATKMVEPYDEQRSMLVSAEEIQQSVLPTLSKMYAQEEGTPENSLIVSASRLNNVAHALIERYETAYLANEEVIRAPAHDTIDAVCRLSKEARENIKFAMEIKKDKSRVAIDLIKAIKK